MTAPPPRWLRLLAPVLCLPARLDHRGLRWALRLCSPFPLLVLTHRGRRSGRCYRTPVELISGSPATEMLVLPFAGHHSDWLRNVTAGGLVAGSCRGRHGPLTWRLADVEEARQALEAYRGRHRLYARALLATVAEVNGLPRPASSAELAAALPVVVFAFASDHAGGGADAGSARMEA